MEFSGLLPIFPLPDVVFFPGTPLPLHVFEPRYLSLVKAAQSGENLIGMVRLQEGWQGDYRGNPPVQPIGSAGYLDKVEPLPGGRFNILLKGLFRFQILEELETDMPFRTVRVKPLDLDQPAEAPKELVAGMKRELLRRFTSFWQKERGERTSLTQLSDSIALPQLVDILAYALPLNPDKKQRLLETFDPFERGLLVHAHLEELLGDSGESFLH